LRDPRRRRAQPPRPVLRDSPEHVGITNLVNRATVAADELTPAELQAGAERLRGTARRYRPASVAVVGVSAYRTAFVRPKARIGRQHEDLEGALLWVLPNPSGLNPITSSTHWLRRSASSAKPSPRARARRRS
jgi:G:T/U-mismatch repair DNA glycosylase